MKEKGMASGGLRKNIKAILNNTWIPFVRYTMKSVQNERRPTALSLFEMAKQRARASSLDYVDAHMPRAMMFSSREQLWKLAVREIESNGLAIEFGVWEGYSIKYFAKHFQVIYGFDSFLGLQEFVAGRLNYQYIGCSEYAVALRLL